MLPSDSGAEFPSVPYPYALLNVKRTYFMGLIGGPEDPAGPAFEEYHEGEVDPDAGVCPVCNGPADLHDGWLDTPDIDWPLCPRM